MQFVAGAKTDVGRGRPANEDSFLVDDARRLYAVADGMGGHRAGEVASATAIESLQRAFGEGQSLAGAVGEANAAVFAKASANLDMRGMGTTLTAVSLAGDRTALVGHVGDSRAYLMRDGAVTQVTDDHSLVEQLVREGRLSPEEAASHPQRAIITRALGVDPEVEVDTYQVDLRPGDRLLLASDGLTNMVSDDTISAVLHRHPDPQEAADRLVDLANQAGGDDNITVVVIDARGDTTGEAIAAGAALGPPETVEEPTGEWVPGPDFSEETAPSADGAPSRPAAVASPAPGAVTEDDGAAAPGRHRRLARILVWLLPVVVLISAGAGALGWYARQTYYVGFESERVTVFRGVPGGLLGWDPTVEARTGLAAADLTPAQRATVADGHRFSSRAGALEFVERLERDAETRAETTTTVPFPGSPAGPGDPP